MTEYREFAPPIELAAAVECFWTIVQNSQTNAAYRVLPDGCADVIFSSGKNGTSLRVSGPMTRFEDFRIDLESCMVGVRFRPGMWASQLGVDASTITDATPALEDLWGKKARQLAEQMANAESPRHALRPLARAFQPTDARSAVQRAIESLGQNPCQSLAYLARQANLSGRQFRRLCSTKTGLTPKLLARILRFRHASARLSNASQPGAALAAECGYADQSHMIADFQRFSGRTPLQYVQAHLAANKKQPHAQFSV